MVRRRFEVVRDEGQHWLLAGASSFGRMGCHCHQEDQQLAEGPDTFGPV